MWCFWASGEDFIAPPQWGILHTGLFSQRYMCALRLLEFLWPAFTHMRAGLHLSQYRVPASPCLVQQQWANSSTYRMLDTVPRVEFQKAPPEPHSMFWSLDLNPGHLLLALCSSQLLSCTGSILLDAQPCWPGLQIGGR